MRASDLDVRELLEFDEADGTIHFAGQRALLFDATAIGLLRRELFDSLGCDGARAILTRLGYAHGWRTANALKDAFPWENATEWRRAGGRLHALQGHVTLEIPEPSEFPAPFAEAIWHASYEAEQHLLHLGRSDQPVCWNLAGFASGYLSYCNQREVICIEHKCVARGDAVCHLVGKFSDEWGDECELERKLYATISIAEALEQAGKLHESVLARTSDRGTGKRDASTGRRKPTRVRLSLESERPRSVAMRHVEELASRVARVDATVLIHGESGVGKERIARRIHQESARTGRVFVALNCGAVPDALLESELFGHAKGAFTGAMNERVGLFEAAHGGTIFLDEIGELSSSMQVSLLRVLQEREIRRVGENRLRRVDVRVLAATHRDLVADVAAGRFRQDLYYRLRVVDIRVPPLRERREDVLPLAREILQGVAERMGVASTGLSAQAASRLLRYSWPGNVRELGNALERALIFSGGATIEAEHLPEEVSGALPDHQAGELKPLEVVEKEYILAALGRLGGNRAAVAQKLGIGEATLYRKLRAWRAVPR